jgi:hypothetical protein
MPKKTFRNAGTRDERGELLFQGQIATIATCCVTHLCFREFYSALWKNHYRIRLLPGPPLPSQQAARGCIPDFRERFTILPILCWSKKRNYYSKNFFKYE